MKSIVALSILSLALVAGCDSGGSPKQGPSTKRGDLAPTTASGCESLEGKARDECMRMTKESGTATPSRPTNTGETPASASAAGSDARAERGSGIEGANSAGTTTGNQPGSVGATTK
jgi:hypothetical protein